MDTEIGGKLEKFLGKLYEKVCDSGLFITLAASGIAIGLLMLVIYATCTAFPNRMAALENLPMDGDNLLLKLGTGILVVGLCVGVVALLELRKSEPSPAELRYSTVMFGRALVGIGYVLLLDALLNIVAIAGFAAHGYEKDLFWPEKALPINQLINDTNVVGAAVTQVESASGAKQPDQTETPTKKRKNQMIRAMQLIFALGFTLMGALFFFAKSLWEKMQDPNAVQYDGRIFWAGLWFRLGEAVVFTVVMFVALLFKQQETFGWMPLIALIIGLSVKSSENLIAGICERVLAAVNGLISK